MTLKEDAKHILENFDTVDSDRMVTVLGHVQTCLKNELTRDYLAGKIQKIQDAEAEPEKKKMCKALLPYLDWYLQGV